MSLSRLWRVARADPRRIVHADREVLAAVLRREARGALAPVRRRGRTALVTLSGLVERGARAEAAYARVLDGRTLNLFVTLPAGAATATVVFARGGRAERVPLEPAPGGASGEATVLLGAGGVALTPGRWRILLDLAFRDGRTETVAPRLTDTGRAGAADGPTVAAPPCPDTGVRYQVGLSPAGALVLTVLPPAPAAEVTGLDVRATGMRLRGRLVGVEDATGTTVVFAGPGRREHAVPARADGTAFAAEVPVASLADGPEESSWRVWAQVPAAGRLRVGHGLTDLRSPQAVHRRPNRMIRLGGRSFALVRTTYAGGGLTLVCAAGEAFEGTAQ